MSVIQFIDNAPNMDESDPEKLYYYNRSNINRFKAYGFFNQTHPLSNFNLQKFKFTTPNILNIESRTIEVCCGEQAIMYMKALIFKDKEAQKKILESKNPREIKFFGRKVLNFDDVIWKSFVCRIAYEVTLQKAKQIPEVLELLKRSENHIIYEGAKNDFIWGTGFYVNHPNNFYPCNWLGSNILGWAWMQTRKTILVSEAETQPEPEL